MDDEELNELFGMEDGEDPQKGDASLKNKADKGAAGNGGMFVVEDHGGVDDDQLDELFGFDEESGPAVPADTEDPADPSAEEKARAKEEKLREKKARKEQKKREKEARKEQKKREEHEREEQEKIEREKEEQEKAEREREKQHEAVEADDEDDDFVEELIRREHREQPQSNLFKPKYVILAFLGVLLITGIVLIFTLDTFKILTINVEGNHVLKTEELIKLSGISTGDHIFFANYTRAARSIKSSSMYVKDCKVSFELPSKVNIKIEERSKICYVKTPDGYAALDDEGTVIELSSFDYEGKIAPVISGLNITHAMLGNKIVIGNESDYQKSLIVLGSLLSADKNNQSRTYSIFENTEEVRVLPSGYIFLTIKLPNGNLLQVKFDSLEKISSQTAWLLYAIDSKVFDKGFPSGSLDMTLEEPVYRQFDVREDRPEDTGDDEGEGQGEDTSESTGQSEGQDEGGNGDNGGDDGEAD